MGGQRRQKRGASRSVKGLRFRVLCPPFGGHHAPDAPPGSPDARLGVPG